MEDATLTGPGKNEIKNLSRNRQSNGTTMGNIMSDRK